MQSRVDENNAVRCGKCGHILFKIARAGAANPSPIIEIKCHSCKTINEWWYRGYRPNVVKAP